MSEYAFLHFPAEAVHVDPQKYARLPESARRVFDAVKATGPLTHSGLRIQTGLPPRTIRFAVKRLKDEGLIDARSSLKDCRSCYFFVSKAFVGEEALEDARRRAEIAVMEGRLVEQV